MTNLFKKKHRTKLAVLELIERAPVGTLFTVSQAAQWLSAHRQVRVRLGTVSRWLGRLAVRHSSGVYHAMRRVRQPRPKQASLFPGRPA